MEAIVVLLLTQYVDTLNEIGARSNTILRPHSPRSLARIAAEIRAASLARRVQPRAPTFEPRLSQSRGFHHGDRKQ